MEKFGEIEIRIAGKKGNLDLAPENYDIREIVTVLQNIEDLLYPISKRDRPIITHDLKKGSVKHIFKTSLQAIIGFSAIMTQISNTGNIDFLELKTAKAIENMQKLSYKNNFQFEINSIISREKKLSLQISPSTKYVRTENHWIDAELYFYGVLTNAGGKGKANIHIDTEDFGSIIIDTPKEFLAKFNDNLLYKEYGIRATGKQNSETGEIDKQSLKFMELINYNPEYDEQYLNSLINNAKENWIGIDPDKWLSEIRGGYDI